MVSESFSYYLDVFPSLCCVFMYNWNVHIMYFLIDFYYAFSFFILMYILCVFLVNFHSNAYCVFFLNFFTCSHFKMWLALLYHVIWIFFWALFLSALVSTVFHVLAMCFCFWISFYFWFVLESNIYCLLLYEVLGLDVFLSHHVSMICFLY